MAGKLEGSPGDLGGQVGYRLLILGAKQMVELCRYARSQAYWFIAWSKRGGCVSAL